MERIINILKTLDRPGIDQVIEFLRESNYAKAGCYNHHKYKGGLVDHSLEVYELMMSRRGKLPVDSVIVCAFFHDLGKAHKYGMTLSGAHEDKSLKILDTCGFSLTEDERSAIANHHKKSADYITSPLRHCLSSSDMSSTGKWKLEHPNQKDSASKRMTNSLLYLLSKI